MNTMRASSSAYAYEYGYYATSAGGRELPKPNAKDESVGA